MPWESRAQGAKDEASLRVVVADSSAVVLRELVSLLSTEFQVGGTAITGTEVLQLIHQSQPDVAVISLRLPELNGIEVIRQLVKEERHPAVVVCSFETSPEIIEASYNAGALGYVLKTRAAVDLVAAVRAAAVGKRFQSPSSAE